MNMKEKVIEVLRSIREGIDYSTCTGIVTNQVLSSLDLLQLISCLEEKFDISIPFEAIVIENFDSVDSITNTIKEIQQQNKTDK